MAARSSVGMAIVLPAGKKDRPNFCAIKIKGFVYILANFRNRSGAKSRALLVNHAKAALIVRAAQHGLN